MHSDQSGADPPIFSLCQSLDFLVCYLTKDPHLRLESTGRCCIASVRPRSQWFIYLHLGMLNNNRIIDYRNLFSFSFLLYRFSKCTREYCINCSRKLGVASVLIACWLLSHMLDGRFKPGSPPTVPHSLQSSIVCRGLVVNWQARTQCTRYLRPSTDVVGAFKITSQQLKHATRHYHQRVDRASPPPVGLSVSDFPPPSTPSFKAELNGSSWRQDIR